MLGWSNSLTYANSTCIALWFAISGVTRDAQHPEGCDGCAFSIICFILFQRNIRFCESRSFLGAGRRFREGLRLIDIFAAFGWSLDKMSYLFILKYSRRTKSYCLFVASLFFFVELKMLSCITLFERWKARDILNITTYMYILSLHSIFFPH